MRSLRSRRLRRLTDTAKDLGPKGRDRDYGAGLVNALKVLTAVRPRYYSIHSATCKARICDGHHTTQAVT